jgi:hypothetical protein
VYYYSLLHSFPLFMDLGRQCIVALLRLALPAGLNPEVEYMGVGHAAFALGASKAAPRLNIGWLIFAAFFADFLLGVFANMGLEQAHVPADYASRHYLTFTFPYSHGLLPLLLWSVIFGLAVSLLQRVDRTKAFLAVAAVVLSHFLLDGIVHVAGLPLAGENSPKFGLGLWKYMPLALALETAMTVVGVILYLKFTGPLATSASRFGVPIFMAVLALLTWTQILITKAPQPSQLIPNWIIAPLVFGALAYVLDRKRARAAAA